MISNINALYDKLYLQQLDQQFLQYLQQTDEELYHYLINKRQQYQQFSEEYGNDSYIVEIAKIIAIFIQQLFDIQSANTFKLDQELEEIFHFRKYFINHYIKTLTLNNPLHASTFNQLNEQLLSLCNLNTIDEIQIAKYINKWHTNIDQFPNEHQIATNWALNLFFNDYLNHPLQNTTLFYKAKKIKFDTLIAINKQDDIITTYTNQITIKRDNFDFYSQEDQKSAFYNSKYCVKCHKRGNDTCKLGDIDKTNQQYKINPLGYQQTGCPLSMHISQMHQLYDEKNILGALIVATINNPLLAVTGNSICYDCISSCIFQKQEAVDTPLVETMVLKDILAQEWGFEIYSLLTKWNPLRVYRPYPKPSTNYNICIAGQGPAGFSLAYNLLQEGHNIIAFDALNIEPLDIPFTPIKDINQVLQDSSHQKIYSWGGVCEYGITARFDKKMLIIIRLILERHHNYRLFSGIKFGHHLTIDNIFNQYQFHHLALACGAGRPIIPDIKHMNAIGIRSASEFLMILHNGAVAKNSIFALQLRLPLIIIGGGLTSIDCATEAIVYYKKQIEHVYTAYYQNVNNSHHLRYQLSDYEYYILQEYLQHYHIFNDPKLTDAEKLQACGGVFIMYHDDFEKSKAYRTNYHEVDKALKQGVKILSNHKLQTIIKKNQHLSHILVNHHQTSKKLTAHNLIIATGTQINTNMLNDHDLNKYYLPESNQMHASNEYTIKYKQQSVSVLLEPYNNSRYISFFGDMNEHFKGKVVDALASTLHGQYAINQVLATIPTQQHTDTLTYQAITDKLQYAFTNYLTHVEYFAQNYYLLTIKAPQLVHKAHLGQLIKLKTNTLLNSLSSEPLVLTIISLNKQQQTLQCILQIKGASTLLLYQALQHNQITITGPFGNYYNFHDHHNVLLMPDNLINVILAINLANSFTNTQFYAIIPHHLCTIPNLIQKLQQSSIVYYYTNQKKLITTINNLLHDISIHQIYLYGNLAFKHKLTKIIKKHIINNEVYVIMYSLMWCTMGGICSTCIIKTSDNQYFYSCNHHITKLYNVDLAFLNRRKRQNRIIEKINFQYIKQHIAPCFALEN